MGREERKKVRRKKEEKKKECVRSLSLPLSLCKEGSRKKRKKEGKRKEGRIKYQSM